MVDSPEVSSDFFEKKKNHRHRHRTSPRSVWVKSPAGEVAQDLRREILGSTPLCVETTVINIYKHHDISIQDDVWIFEYDMICRLWFGCITFIDLKIIYNKSQAFRIPRCPAALLNKPSVLSFSQGSVAAYTPLDIPGFNLGLWTKPQIRKTLSLMENMGVSENGIS